MSNFKREYKSKDLNIPEGIQGEVPLHSKLDIEQLVFRQIERTNQAAVMDESFFAANVRILLSYVPTNKRIEILDRENDYTSTTTTYQYKYFCSVPLGTPENPVNGSPALIEEKVTEWHKLYEIILDVFESLGITWKQDSHTVETMNRDDMVLPEPTPTFEGAVSEMQSVADKSVRVQHCAVCKGIVSGDDSGKHKYHKLIHDRCEGAADLKWGVSAEVPKDPLEL
jgi:hypothetical protein